MWLEDQEDEEEEELPMYFFFFNLLLIESAGCQHPFTKLNRYDEPKEDKFSRARCENLEPVCPSEDNQESSSL